MDEEVSVRAQGETGQCKGGEHTQGEEVEKVE